MIREADPTLTALERIYRGEFKAFVRTAMAHLGEVDAARDAVQEGMAHAIRNRASYRGEGTLEAWLWRVMLNTIRTHYRERERRTLLPLGEDVGDTASPSSPNGRIAEEAVRLAIRRLPERQRLVLFLRFYADLDYTTIASLLGMSEGTVGAALSTARATLRGLLKEVRT